MTQYWSKSTKKLDLMGYISKETCWIKTKLWTMNYYDKSSSFAEIYQRIICNKIASSFVLLSGTVKSGTSPASDSKWGKDLIQLSTKCLILSEMHKAPETSSCKQWIQHMATADPFWNCWRLVKEDDLDGRCSPEVLVACIWTNELRPV